MRRSSRVLATSCKSQFKVPGTQNHPLKDSGWKVLYLHLSNLSTRSRVKGAWHCFSNGLWITLHFSRHAAFLLWTWLGVKFMGFSHLRYLALLCAELSTSYQPVAWPSTTCDCIFWTAISCHTDTIFTILDLAHATQGFGFAKFMLQRRLQNMQYSNELCIQEFVATGQGAWCFP